MSKHRVLISGSTIAQDKELINKLRKSAVILTNTENALTRSIVGSETVDLILFEISKNNASELKIIKKIKTDFPEMTILLIDGNGDSELTAEAFSCGVRDAFRKPYKGSLIAERVNAILSANK